MLKILEKKRVLVAMSGGVDSSVSAALLKKAGFQVAGVFLRCYEQGGCGTIEDLSMARLASDKIGIPFYVFDFRKEYKNKVIDYFIKGYASGKTPNPDIVCNSEIKFNLLFKKAMALGFDYLATGHYANIKKHGKKLRILKGKDPNKDQSYFLYALNPEVLPKLIFPVGKYMKKDVRGIAKKFGLPNAKRKDSQGICFIGKVKLYDFLKDFLPPRQGKIIDDKGDILGKHKGFYYYTIGQRKGLNLSGGPYYIYKTDSKKNIVFVTKKKSKLDKKEVFISDLKWFSDKGPDLPLRVNAKIRYRHKGASARLIKKSNSKFLLVFNKPQWAIAPGQSAVFYKGNELLGGGIICN
ncbi:MAG: tRNA 2-thiouridine(34) synthase MnmA [Candidatus Parcubacteria bacterium]|nr:tRNA 2-thiouridine(34) synthase MnmA [Candidatus Parcubacteria bacterium]